MKTNDAAASGLRLSRRDVLRGIGALGCAALVSKLPMVQAASTSVRCALLGDWGDGDQNTARIAAQMAIAHDVAPLNMVVTAGDNIYPNGSGEYFGSKFERPFEPVLKRSVPVYACLGNHDVRSGGDAQMRYSLFHMGGKNYYSIPTGGGTAEFFILDSNDMDSRQVAWLDDALSKSTAIWKVAVLHHPPFSSGKRHGSSTDLRKQLHPLFVRQKVSAVFSGHDHVYQRVTLQDGVQYFVTGAGGKIRRGDLDTKDSLVAAGYDEDSHFMLVDIDATHFEFEAISASGAVVDRGALREARERLPR